MLSLLVTKERWYCSQSTCGSSRLITTKSTSSKVKTQKGGTCSEFCRFDQQYGFATLLAHNAAQIGLFLRIVRNHTVLSERCRRDKEVVGIKIPNRSLGTRADKGFRILQKSTTRHERADILFGQSMAGQQTVRQNRDVITVLDVVDQMRDGRRCICEN